MIESLWPKQERKEDVIVFLAQSSCCIKLQCFDALHDLLVHQNAQQAVLAIVPHHILNQKNTHKSKVMNIDLNKQQTNGSNHKVSARSLERISVTVYNSST